MPKRKRLCPVWEESFRFVFHPHHTNLTLLKWGKEFEMFKDEEKKKSRRIQRGTVWLTIASSRSIESLRRSAKAISTKWPGRYRFRIYADQIDEQKQYSLCLGHKF